MKKNLLFSIFIILLSGCNKNNDISCNYDEMRLEQSVTISPEEAIMSLKSFVNIHNDVTTKSSEIIDFNVCDIEAIGAKELSIKTKAYENSIPDTLFYIANLNDGYAILSGNRELDCDVFCITESGELHSEDFASAYDFLVSDNFVKSSDANDEFIEMGPKIVPAILLSSILNDYQLRAVAKSNSTDTDIDGNGNLKTETSLSGTKYGPYLKTKWTNSKMAPFNSYTPNNAYPGCVAIAVAQIMEYNKKSNTMVFNGVTCNWNTVETVCNYTSINNIGTVSAQKQVGNFIYELGKRRNCYVRYDNSSWAVADGAKRTLRNYGYNNVTKRIGFASGDEKKVTEQIKAGRPVYMGGCTSGSTSNGHAWVIDGLIGDYYHINWGWHGKSDGYYRIGVFTTSSRSAVDSIIDANVNGKQDAAYTWTYRIVLYSL